MTLRLIGLIGLMLAPVLTHAQHRIRMVTPNGDTATYVRERSRIVTHTIIRTDTVVKIERDTTHDTLDRYYYHREIQDPLYLSFTLQPTPIEPPQKKSSIGIFGYADFRGACVAPAASIDLGSMNFWIYVGGYYVTDGRHIATWTAGISAFTPVFKF